MSKEIQRCNCTNSVTKESACVKDQDCCIEEVGTLVQKLVRVFQLFERDQIKVHGFTTSQCYALIELYKAGSLTMNELSEKMNLNTSTMTRIMDNLVRDKYVIRDRDESDRRIVVVSLTDEGKEATAKLNETVTDYYRQIIANIPEGQVEEIFKSVEVLLKAFEKANPNCC
jgi:MarR family transcriptional regulator, organic hydroperoxide resistance regulator